MTDENVPPDTSRVAMALATSDATKRIDAVESRIDAHDRRIGQLEVDMGEIRGFLGQTATKADVADLGARIQAAINGLLRDALNAMPVRQAAIWGAVVALATIGMLLVTLLPR